jgi:hypothetical protein
MDTNIIPLSELREDPEGLLRRCCDSGEPLVVALPDHRLVRIEPVPDDDLVDDLIETNAAFRELLDRSRTSPRRPFPLEDESE